jgi:hypothetical protein
MNLDFYQVNERLKQILASGVPANILRLCNTSRYVIECLLQGERPVHQFMNQNTLVEYGIFPFDVEFVLNDTFPKIIHTIESCDLLGLVDVGRQHQLEPAEVFSQKYGHKEIFSGKQFEIFDPGSILGVSSFQRLDDPWTKYLKDKRVLVISTHRDSMLRQWDRIDKVWGEHRNTIAPFDLVDVIRTPYHPMYDTRQLENCNNWYETIEAIANKVSTYDYDVLFSGTSGSSPFYTMFAKSMGKVGIQVGGSIQLFFGILGGRWDSTDAYKAWRGIFNEHWIRPLESDRPNLRDRFSFETNFAYW